MRYSLVIASAIAASLALTVKANAFTSAHCGLLDPGPKPASQILSYTAALMHYSAPSEDQACFYYGRGLVYHFEGKYELAIADYTSALGQMSNFGEAHAALGDAYDSSGQHDKADAEHRTAWRIEQDNVLALNGSCWQRTLRGAQLDLAMVDCNRAIELEGSDPAIWDTHCLANYRLGRYGAAISDCDKAVELWHGETWWAKAGSLYVRGLAKIKNGEIDDGQSDIAAAKALYQGVSAKYAIFGVTQ